MNARTALWIAFLLGSGVGCSQAPTSPPSTSTPAAAATPAVRTIAKCGGAGSVGTCPSGSGPCFVDISVPSGASVPEVKPFELLVNPRSGPQHLVWRLSPGAHFNPAQGDGIFIKTDDKDQFWMNYATDDPNGNPGSGRKGKNYHWQFDNDSGKRSRYEYLVRFHVGTTPYECDPLINNQGGG